MYITLFCKCWVLEQPTQVRILIKKSVHLQSWLSNIVLTLHCSDSDDPNRRGKKQKKGSSGLLACLPLSDALVKFLGTGENSLSRAGAVKRMWEYIKQNDLQVWCCFLVKPMLKWSVTLFPPFWYVITTYASISDWTPNLTLPLVYWWRRCHLIH